jgi:CRISPR-associated protein Cas5d
LDEIIIEVWGDFACFSEPQAKVERLSYPFPTPSAARGILSAIYSKPVEFYWQVNRIEVLNPIQYISFKRNEVKCTVSGREFVYTEEERTQRQTVALKDVRYRVAASIIPRPAFHRKETQLYEQALRRIRGGKAFMQPSLGLREFVAYFEEYQPSAEEKKPIADTLDAGLMVYDVFDFIHDTAVQKKTKSALSLFHAVMEQGVVQVPPYESPEVLKGASIC